MTTPGGCPDPGWRARDGAQRVHETLPVRIGFGRSRSENVLELVRDQHQALRSSSDRPPLAAAGAGADDSLPGDPVRGAWVGGEPVPERSGIAFAHLCQDGG